MYYSLLLLLLFTLYQAKRYHLLSWRWHMQAYSPYWPYRLNVIMQFANHWKLGMCAPRHEHWWSVWLRGPLLLFLQGNRNAYTQTSKSYIETNKHHPLLFVVHFYLDLSVEHTHSHTPTRAQKRMPRQSRFWHTDTATITQTHNLTLQLTILFYILDVFSVVLMYSCDLNWMHEQRTR